MTRDTDSNAPGSTAVARARAALSLLLASLVAASSSAQPTPSRIPIEVTPAAAEQHGERIRRSAAETIEQLSIWLGPFPAPALRIDLHDRPRSADVPNGTVTVQLPWLAAPPAMDVEAEVAYVIAMKYWPHDMDSDGLFRGLAWYLQGHIVERLFNVAFAKPGHHFYTEYFFGGQVPWSFPTLRVMRAGAVRSTTREALRFMALERHLGWPVLQGALKVLAASAREEALTRAKTAAVIGAATGEDLSWAFDTSLDARSAPDYAVRELTSTLVAAPCPAAGCVRTRVTVARSEFGSGSGSASPGTSTSVAVPLQVTFDDGQTVSGLWDTREPRRAFDFESPAPPRFVRLDPQGVLLADPTRLDHTRFAAPQSNVPVLKWVSRWLVWLQDALVTATALV